VSANRVSELYLTTPIDFTRFALGAVQKVDWTTDMADWGDEDCKRVGSSLATFIRKRKTGEAAIDAWRLHYPQLNILFNDIEGFLDFVLVISNNTLRDR